MTASEARIPRDWKPFKVTKYLLKLNFALFFGEISEEMLNFST